MYDTQQVVFRYLVHVFGPSPNKDQELMTQKQARLWVEHYPKESAVIDKALEALAPRNGAAFEELCQYVIAVCRSGSNKPRVPFRLEPFKELPGAVQKLSDTIAIYF